MDKDPNYRLRRAGIAVAAALATVLVGKEVVVPAAYSLSRQGNVEYIPDNAFNKPEYHTWKKGGRILVDKELGFVNVRTSPEKIDTDTGTNTCAKPEADIDLPEGVEVITETSGADTWKGFDADQLPEAVREDCGYDKDDLLWVASEYTERA